MFEHSNSKICSEVAYLQKSLKAVDNHKFCYFLKKILNFLLHKTLYSTCSMKPFFLHVLFQSTLQCLHCLITSCPKVGIRPIGRACRLTLPNSTKELSELCQPN